MIRRGYFFLVLTAALIAANAAAQPAPALPDADTALAAYRHFAADPVNRLESTRPFLDFIRSSGRVHIVLNEALLGWMYADISEEHKAVLYAAFLGGNMAGQLERADDSGGSDDLSGMRGALAAYVALRAAGHDLTVPLFETLNAAAQRGEFAGTVARIAADGER